MKFLSPIKSWFSQPVLSDDQLEDTQEINVVTAAGRGYRVQLGDLKAFIGAIVLPVLDAVRYSPQVLASSSKRAARRNISAARSIDAAVDVTANRNSTDTDCGQRVRLAGYTLTITAVAIGESILCEGPGKVVIGARTLVLSTGDLARVSFTTGDVAGAVVSCFSPRREKRFWFQEAAPALAETADGDEWTDPSVMRTFIRLTSSGSPAWVEKIPGASFNSLPHVTVEGLNVTAAAEHANAFVRMVTAGNKYFVIPLESDSFAPPDRAMILLRNSAVSGDINVSPGAIDLTLRTDSYTIPPNAAMTFIRVAANEWETL